MRISRAWVGLLVWVAAGCGGSKAGTTGGSATGGLSATASGTSSRGSTSGASSASGTTGGSHSAGSSGSTSAASTGGASTGTGASGTTSSASSSGTGSTGSGRIAIVVPLQLDAASYAQGATVHATVTYGNPGSTPASLRQAVITLRPPGATHAGGPYDDLAPGIGPTTLAPGATVTLSGQFTLPASGPDGTWEAYATYQDLQNVYVDGPSVFFSVAAAATTSGSATGTTSAASTTAGASSGSTGGASTTGGGTGTGGTTTGTTGASAAPFTVSGNKILDANGVPHLFHGVARPSLEWDPNGNHLSLADYQLMASAWHANTVRISLCQDFWLSGAALYSPGYQALVAQNVAWAEQAGLDVILDLHWTDEGNLAISNSNQGQKPMADVNSIRFWSEVATQFKNDPHVLFELFNEPFDVSWDVWLNGGPTPAGGGFTAAGMQQLYDAVRGTGATNLVVIGGLSWSADLTGIPTHRVQGTNIVYNTHIYDYPGTQKGTWDGLFGFLTATDPVIATEFGQYDCGTQFVSDFIAYADAHNMGWTSWAWFPSGCAFPSIISDWSGTPTAMGVPVQNALLHY